MKIAVDYDDVLVPFVNKFLAWHNERNNTGYDVQAMEHFHFGRNFGGSEQMWTDSINVFHGLGLSAQLDPNEGAVEALRYLAKDHDVVILTSRPSMHREHLEKWVDKHVSGIVGELHMFDGKDQTKPTTGHNKGAVCREIGAGLLIDDNNGHIESAVSQGVGGILFGDHRWTQDHRHKYEGASNWGEAIKIVDSNYS